MKNVAEPKYKLPTRKHLSKTVVPEMYEKVKVKIENILEPVQYVSITTHVWSSTVNDDYLSITAHFLDDNYKMQHVCLEVIPFSHESLGKWGLLEKLSYVVRDNARNMSATMEKAGFKYVSCFAHTLQLVIKDSVFNQKEGSNVITICRRLVGHFKDSLKANKQLKAAHETLHMPQKCMIYDEPTKWNSTCHMLKKFWREEDHWPFKWLLIEVITEILFIFENTTLAISYPNVNVGATIPIINSIAASLKEICALKGMTNDLLASLQRRFGNCEFDQCHATATILDACYKTNVFVSNEAVIAAKQHI
ncbi:hypothetical protein PR048_006606 [Dryococelus australis]|uniref:Uncharacterized protein n=1 Tax=Dryococelus australis TaxID=614101 RepID=A0ABQ9IBI3_9NEOP|nr:hypothetical protein PR048_006606 [Dryococelus australis]